MDDQYQTYINRVVAMTRSEHHQSQWPLIQSSPKFRPPTQPGATAWEAVPFPGYTIVTPSGSEDKANPRFYKALGELQVKLADLIPSPFGLALPPESFHFTLADLVWDRSYLQAIAANPTYEPQIQGAIAQTFAQQAPQVSQGQPILLQVMGFVVMTRAIGLCLAPHTESDYERLVGVRRSVYQSPHILALGIEQQYHFTAHITLGYFGQLPDTIDPLPLSQGLEQLTHDFLETCPEFTIDQVELRKFDNMTHYFREPDWPVLRF